MAKRYQRVIRSRKSKNDRQYNGLFWSLYCLSFFGLRLLLITLWYLLAIVLSVILRFTATSDYPLVSFGHYIVCHSSVYGYFWLPFGIFCTLHCLSFFALRLLLITLWYLLAIVLSLILRFTALSDYPLVSFGHCIVCHSSVYGYFSFMAKRYQRVIRSSRQPKNDRQCNGQKIPKGNQKP
jgi:flagellar biosynthesis protein FliP